MKRCNWMNCSATIALATIGLWFCSTAGAVVIDFEDLTLAPESVWKGVDPVPGDGQGVSDNFTSGGAIFDNYREIGDYDSWSGWAYSNRTYNPNNYVPGDYNPGDGSNGNANPVPVGWAGEFYAAAGAGAGGSATYGVAYPGFDPDTFATIPPKITLPQDGQLQGAQVTNVNWSYYTMLEGDPPGPYGFAKKFTEADEDWFQVTVTGKDALGSVVGTVPVYLADMRPEAERTDNDRKAPYILKDWTYVDLSSLADAATLEFAFASSDVSFGFPNTPTYVAIDNITMAVPEPSTIGLIGTGLCCGLVWWRRNRKK